MPLQATSGAASYDAFGGGVPVVPNYIEDVFSTWLYTGTGVALNINNGIDLSGKGGLVWIKQRSGTGANGLIDTVRGRASILYSNTAGAATTDSSSTEDLTSFNSNGFSLGSQFNFTCNSLGQTFASWTFRKQTKFFDIVTWTGDGVAGRSISHNLGSTPGCILVKRISGGFGEDWQVYHRSLSAGQNLVLNTSVAATTQTPNAFGTVTSTGFQLPNSGVGNSSGYPYVAYIFAHNAGGFGLTGTDNVISCGSYIGNGDVLNVDLGFEPQWLLVKRANQANSDWVVVDNMRGAPVLPSYASYLTPNTSDAEVVNAAGFHINSTGFNVDGFGLDGSFNGQYIYIAIRRGPMRTPTTGTSVFNSITRTGTGSTANITGAGFPPDMIWNRNRGGGYETDVNDKLRGAKLGLFTPYTQAETDLGGSGMTIIGQDGCTVATDGSYNANGGSFVLNFWRRAPGFFDEVCYTGDSSAFRAVPHNLGVAPELMIFKTRSNANPWWVYAAPVGATKYLTLNTGNSAITLDIFGNTAPTSSVFYVNGNYWINFTATVVAYLFASVPGVSKVGGYTGTGTTQTINCGFTGGARFVMIKRTDNAGGGFAGDWYVWDSARGIVAGNDPYLLLNSTTAEVTNTDYIDTASTGFEISSTAPADINASGGTYIFLAIA